MKPREHLKHEARLAHLKTMHRIQKQGLHVCTIGDTILCGYITIRSIFNLSSRSRNGGGIGSLEHWQELLLPCVSTVRSLKALLPLLEPCHLLDAPYCRRQNPLNPPYTLALTQLDTKMPETGLSHVWQILELTLPAKALTEQRRLTVWIYVLATRTCQTRFLVRSNNYNGFSQVSFEGSSKQKVKPPRTPTRDPPRTTNHIGFRMYVQHFSTNYQEARSVRFGRTWYSALSGFQSSLLLCTYMHAGFAYVCKQRRRHVPKGSLVTTAVAASGHMQIACNVVTAHCSWTHSSHLTMANPA